MSSAMRHARKNIRDMRSAASHEEEAASPLLDSQRFGDGSADAAVSAENGVNGDGASISRLPLRRTGTELWRIARARTAAVKYTMGEGVGAMMSFGTTEEEAPAGLFSPFNDVKVVWGSIRRSYLSIMLMFIPLGIAAVVYKWDARLVFGFNFLSLVPLALLLGEVTEDLALRFGGIVGGLLNATFGNVVEVILSLSALHKGLFSVVATSLLGSILSNLLLVLGCCFLFGGTRYHEQTFNALANKTLTSLLFMSCISVLIPTASRHLYGHDAMSSVDNLALSRVTALVVAGVYVAYLLFQLKTHRAAFGGEEEEEGAKPTLSTVGAIACLGGITVVVAVCSEFLTGAIEDVSKSSLLSLEFLGLIVLPIAGNACEHITAVFVAVKNNMDLAIGIALGSSIQIAAFAIPLSVLVGWAIGQPFSLNFDPFATLVLTLSVIHAYFVTADARSNWLMGLQLVGTYVLIGSVFFFVHTPPDAALGQ